MRGVVERGVGEVKPGDWQEGFAYHFMCGMWQVYDAILWQKRATECATNFY